MHFKHTPRWFVSDKWVVSHSPNSSSENINNVNDLRSQQKSLSRVQEHTEWIVIVLFLQRQGLKKNVM